MMQDFPYTQDAPTLDTRGNLRSDPITSQVFKGNQDGEPSPLLAMMNPLLASHSI